MVLPGEDRLVQQAFGQSRDGLRRKILHAGVAVGTIRQSVQTARRARHHSHDSMRVRPAWSPFLRLVTGGIDCEGARALRGCQVTDARIVADHQVRSMENIRDFGPGSLPGQVRHPVRQVAFAGDMCGDARLLARAEQQDVAVEPLHQQANERCIMVCRPIAKVRVAGRRDRDERPGGPGCRRIRLGGFACGALQNGERLDTLRGQLHQERHQLADVKVGRLQPGGRWCADPLQFDPAETENRADRAAIRVHPEFARGGLVIDGEGQVQRRPAAPYRGAVQDTGGQHIGCALYGFERYPCRPAPEAGAAERHVEAHAILACG